LGRQLFKRFGVALANVLDEEMARHITFADLFDLAGTPPTRYYARSDQAQLY